MGDGVATPALVGDKLYVFTRQEGKEILRCLDAGTGDEAWQKSYDAEPAKGAAGGFPGPRSSPTVADGKVITFGVGGVLCCFDGASGNELWRKDEFAGSYPMFFTSSSPIVVGGLCVAQVGGSRDGGIVAYDLATGQERWRWMESGPGYASPVLMTIDGTKAIIAPTDSGRNDGKLVAIDSASGKLLWEIPYSEVRYIATTPIVNGSTLIVAGPGNGITAFTMKKEGDKLVEEKLWSNPDNSVGFNTPVLKNKLLFGISGSDQLFCIDTEAKKTAWSAPFSKATAAGQDAAKPSTSQSPSRVPATYVQFVQQENEKKDQPGQRPRGESDRGPRPGGPGRFGPGGRGGGFGGRGRMGGMATRGYGSIVDADSVLVALTPRAERRADARKRVPQDRRPRQRMPL